ncbi:kinase-like protein [Schizopora paradoxa]|uniref:Kinase-like protein n=1 Tax=Schizopora paradoxa TaxID=27342 RepID=A0A0H2R8Q0_9AGAM|nr:kinase-like protein [Schizopora paradoxa]
MTRLQEILSSLSHLNLRDAIIDKKVQAGGYGGSCDVFTAWSLKHNKSVAVKQVRVYLRLELGLAKRLGKEIKIWAALHHANVLPFLGFLVEGDNMAPSLVSEWMANGTLFHFMKRIPRAGIIARIILRGIASGLHYLHAHFVIHADLKSSNILMSSSGTPLLADFGLSLTLTQTQSSPMSTSSSSTSKGTVRWMAIELLSMNEEEPARKPDEKSDVWAFGMIVYEMLSWKLPYWKKTQDALVIVAINNGTLPVKPDAPHSTIFDHLWILALLCWIKEAALRPDTEQIVNYLSSALKPGDDSIIGSSYTRRRLWRKIIRICVAVYKLRSYLPLAQIPNQSLALIPEPSFISPFDVNMRASNLPLASSHYNVNSVRVNPRAIAARSRVLNYCVACKRYHRKCDNGTPCKTCIQKKRTCVRVSESPSAGPRSQPESPPESPDSPHALSNPYF